jgi:hypothetical protein
MCIRHGNRDSCIQAINAIESGKRFMHYTPKDG